MSALRVLVIDDSPVCRDALRRIVEAEGDIAVVDEGASGEEAVELAAAVAPDLILMDVQMPGGGGLMAIERIMASRPVPILVVTGLPSGPGSDLALEAVCRGALNLVAKPMMGDDAAEAELRDLVRALARVPVVRHLARRREATPRSISPSLAPPRAAVIGIGASAGGPGVLAAILGRLPPGFGACVAVVQHLPLGFADTFADFLRAHVRLPVRVVTDEVDWAPGTVLLARDDHHLVATARGGFAAVREPVVERYRPSVDRLFRSLALRFGALAAGVVLSGIGDDGADGLAELRDKGALTIAQDEASCPVYGMPRAAVARGAAALVLPPAAIARRLIEAAQPAAPLRRVGP